MYASPRDTQQGQLQWNGGAKSSVINEQNGSIARRGKGDGISIESTLTSLKLPRKHVYVPRFLGGPNHLSGRVLFRNREIKSYERDRHNKIYIKHTSSTLICLKQTSRCYCLNNGWSRTSKNSSSVKVKQIIWVSCASSTGDCHKTKHAITKKKEHWP